MTARERRILKQRLLNCGELLNREYLRQEQVTKRIHDYTDKVVEGLTKHGIKIKITEVPNEE